MVNWGSIFAMAVNLQILLSETKNMQHHYYDWLLGIAQVRSFRNIYTARSERQLVLRICFFFLSKYVIGFIVTFIGMRGLHGASRALLSKVSPANMKLPTNIGTIMSFSMLFAQFLADLHILTVALSHRVINTDIVNSLVVPMLIACLAAYYFVRKHFFFLM